MSARNTVFIFVEILAALLGVTSCLLLVVNRKQPLPYMDEIFHIPQAKRFCAGNFSEWDPMITTLPGLYVTSLSVLYPVQWLFAVPMRMTCSTLGLRAVNVLITIVNVILICFIVRRQAKREPGIEHLLTSVALGTLPVLYFFSFLYYTDAAAAMFVLLALAAHLHGHLLWAGLAGAMAVTCRQTNVVWVVFLAGCVAEEEVIKLVTRKSTQVKVGEESQWSYIFTVINTILTKCTLRDLLQLCLGILRRAYGYVLVTLGFGLFVYLNGGIVVGAKTDHVAGLHFAQLYYFAAFCGFFAFPHLISINNTIEFVQFLRKHFMVVCGFCVVSGCLIWNFTHAHKYLLADNRHYTFYIWARILNRNEYAKLALIPAYLYAFWCLDRTTCHKSVLWRMVFMICLAVNVVPSMLLELRYFIIPYLVWRLNTQVSAVWRIAVEIMFNIFVNAVTIYLFLERPFLWPNESKLQRFMW